MSTIDKKYTIKLDTKNSLFNTIPVFSLSDNETSDFNIRITNANRIINLQDVIVVIVAINPNNEMLSDFVEVEKAEEGLIYCNLRQSFKNITGVWNARLMLIYENEKVVTSTFSYKVNTDEFVQLNEQVIPDDRFPVLTDLISRLSQIEIQENNRQEAETGRVEAEKQREIIKQQLITDMTKLIEDTNFKIDNYKLEKDVAINLDLQQYKETTTQDINIYKEKKDLEIDEDLENYKTATTKNIDAYKNAKNIEIDNYKAEKDLEIDTYVASKNKELDNYTLAKNTEINEFKNLKDTEIDAKLKEVDTAEQSRVAAETKRAENHQAREEFLNSFESQLQQIETKNTNQDDRLNKVEYTNERLDYVNKKQNIIINGLLNENADGRLSIEGEGNNLKLEGSKAGLVEVSKVVGNTLVNLATIKSGEFNFKPTASNGVTIPLSKRFNGLFTVIMNIKEHSLNKNCKIVLNCENNISIYNSGIPVGTKGIYVFKLETFRDGTYYDMNSFRLYTDNTTEGVFSFDNLIILEGDYTNKPIPSETFEGLKSSFEENLVTQEMVTQGLESEENLGKYKVPIKVVGKNKANPSNIQSLYFDGTTRSIKYSTNVQSITFECTRNTDYIISFDKDVNRNLVCGFEEFPYNGLKSLKEISFSVITNSKVYKFNSGDNKYVMFYYNNELIDISIQIEEGTVATDYEEYFERTTNVYLNSPLLEGDEIVTYDGQLCHYHKCSETVFDGSDDENWRTSSYSTTDCIKAFSNISDAYNSALTVINDSMSSIVLTSAELTNFIGNNIMINLNSTTGTTGGNILICVNSSLLSSTNLSGLKTWLQANPLTIVYPLAQPYYEKISTDKLLLECSNSSTLHIDTVIPVESVKVSYTGNIPSVYALQETNGTQDNLIDISLCATDEMYMMIEPLLEAIPQTINNERMISKMVDMYVAMVIRGLKTIEEVPARYRKEVQSILDKLEK